jgi:hypothetical protein
MDNLMESPLKRKAVGINNARRAIEHDYKSPRKKQIMKEYLYRNLLTLMEQGKIKLLKSPELFKSLKSVQVEEDVDTKKTKIFGKYTHVAEGLVRAAYCIKEKHLNIWIT